MSAARTPRPLAAVVTLTLLPMVLFLTPAAAGVAAVTCGGQSPTITGTPGSDVLVGTAGDDVIVGLDGYDSIEGLAGDDIICGGRQVDSIDAGKGHDQVWGGADGRYHGIEGDSIMGGPGNDELHGGNDASETGGVDKHEDIVVYSGAPRGIQITLGLPTVTGQGIDTIEGFYSVVGSEHDDDITGGAETDVVRALGGDDHMMVASEEGEVFGGSGDDESLLGFAVYGGKGSDTIRRAVQYADGGPGRDRMIGTLKRDNFRGGTGPDLLRGREGGDFLDGTKGHNDVLGGAGADWLRGGGSPDRLRGGSGSDLLEPGDYVDNHGPQSRRADDNVDGGRGHDTVSYPEAHRDSGIRIDLATAVATRVGRDTLRRIESARGSTGNDVIIGDRGANELAGLEGNDLLLGRAGDDDLTMAWTDGEGPSGSDTFRGGKGRDLVDYYLSNVSHAVVVDLAAGTSSGQGSDTMRSIERVRGTVLGDHLRGDRQANILWGGPGDDVIAGRGGSDRARGGSGVDTCHAEIVSTCED